MRAPDFWWRDRPTLPSLLLAPAAALYGAVAAARMDRTGASAAIPILCVGNFVAGGAGKTPTALAIAARLIAAGETPAFLTRGYGSAAARAHGARRVDPAADMASDVGDEALLLARLAPTFAGADRVASARAAEASGASILVMDDGLQNPSLRKDFALAVVAGGRGAGNWACIPAGPLRASLQAQLAHVDALVIVGEGAAGERVATLASAAGKPIYRAALRPDPAIAAKLRGRRVVAFAGIGAPEKFFETLSEIGADMVAAEAFADHHAFTQSEIEALRRRAATAGASLVTTEKDRARLPAGFAGGLPVPQALPVTLEFADEPAFERALGAAVRAARASRPATALR